MKKELDSKPIYSERILKTKIKSYNGKINTNFQINKISKESSQGIFLSVIVIDSAYRKDKDYYDFMFITTHKITEDNLTLPEGLHAFSSYTALNFFQLYYCVYFNQKRDLIKQKLEIAPGE